jgi:hypothetical protein
MVSKRGGVWAIKSKCRFKEIEHASEKINYNEIICLARRNSEKRKIWTFG